MPINPNYNPAAALEVKSTEERKKEPDYCQEHWYILAAQYAAGLVCLDVGAGTGYGLGILRSGGAKVAVGIDPAPAGDSVINVDPSYFGNSTFDLVTAFDVIEHVQDDKEFLSGLLRVANIGVILSTPNYAVWECKNIMHVREYTHGELTQLLSGLEYICWTCGHDRMASGGIRHIPNLAAADTTFIVFIKGKNCSDLVWPTIVNAAEEAAMNVAPRLSRLRKWLPEWETELLNAVNHASTHAGKIRAAVDWIERTVPLVEASVIPPGQRKSEVDFLRAGNCTSEEQLALTRWMGSVLRAKLGII